MGEELREYAEDVTANDDVEGDVKRHDSEKSCELVRGLGTLQTDESCYHCDRRKNYRANERP